MNFVNIVFDSEMLIKMAGNIDLDLPIEANTYRTGHPDLYFEEKGGREGERLQDCKR
jgi:hypothetical protein